MVDIARSIGSYSVVATAALRPNAQALSRVAQAAGNTPPPSTEINLRTQLTDLTRFIENVAVEAEALAGLELTRGLSRSFDISATVSDALGALQQRLGGTESLLKQRQTPDARRSNGAAALLAVLSEGNDGFDFSALIANRARKTVPNEVRVDAARAAAGDPFDRGIPVTATAGGSATLSLQRTALRAAPVEIPLDARNPSLGFIRAPAYEPDGPVQSDNDAFAIQSIGSQGDDTIIIDTRDPTNEDTRLSAVTVEAGDGSDVVFVAGNNVSRINAGLGDDVVAAEGDAIISGGEGDDLLFGRNVSGDAGNDVIFTDGFASGGDGDDSITVFSLDRSGAGDGIRKLAFGGAGRDQIIASVEADIDGGADDDVLVLRAGGSAGGGAGDDTISAWSRATIEGGDGDDDIYMLFGGNADGGAGNDRISLGTYGTVGGGRGSDEVILNRGGVYLYARGDGSDRVTMRKAASNFDDNILEPTNRIVLTGYAPGEVTIDLQATSLTIQATDPSLFADRIEVDRELLGDLEIAFRKDGVEQVLKISGLTQTLGAPVPIAP